MSYAEAWGLYPQNSLKTLTLAMVPGDLKNDGLNTNGYNRLIVKVDKNIYDTTHQRMMDNWASRTDYQLLTRDCLTFTIDMAQTAGLSIPDRTGFDNIPWTYVRSLIDANN